MPSSRAPRSHHKLCFKYFGPFKILSKVGTVAYKLELPPSSAIHHVFHVSLLKSAPAATSSVAAALPDPDNMLQISERVLQTRMHQRGHRSVQQLLIKWSDLDDEPGEKPALKVGVGRCQETPSWAS
jgi:hypothetical protein